VKIVNKTAETGTGMELSYLPSSKFDVSMIIPSELIEIRLVYFALGFGIQGACMEDIAEKFGLVTHRILTLVESFKFGEYVSNSKVSISNCTNSNFKNNINSIR
jgi:hypothetical protein